MRESLLIRQGVPDVTTTGSATSGTSWYVTGAITTGEWESSGGIILYGSCTLMVASVLGLLSFF